MDWRTGLVALCVALLLAPTLAYTYTDLEWNDSFILHLDKASYAAGEPITGSVSIADSESYPIVAQKIVLQLAQGTYYYPSQDSTDNILAEQYIQDIWVLPKSMKRVQFSIPSPGAGSYRVDAYSWVLKSKFWGASSIFLNPISQTFSVAGTPSAGNASIQKKSTVFGAEGKAMVAGPIGFPVDAGGTIDGKVFITNGSSETKGSLKLLVSMCDWAIVFCDAPQEKSFDVPSMAPGETKEVDLELTAPAIPSAYEINMKVMNGSKIESIYKSRAIVTGGTAKLRKIFISGLADKKYSVSALMTGSPDHFTNPTFESFSVTAEAYSAGQKIEEHSLDYAKIGMDDILDANFTLDAKMFDRICMIVKKGGTEYEKECFSVPLTDIQGAYDAAHPELVKVDYAYNEAQKELKVTLTKKTLPVNARIRIFTSDQTLFEDEAKGGYSFTKTYGLEKEDITMTVDDFDAKMQQVFTLNLALGSKTQLAVDTSAEAQQSAMASCAGSVCGEGMACSVAVYNSSQGACCPAVCAPAVSSSGQLSVADVPLIVWVAVLMAILAAGISFSVFAKVRKGGLRR